MSEEAALEAAASEGGTNPDKVILATHSGFQGWLTRSANSAKWGHAKSLQRDAEFMRVLSLLAENGERSVRVPSLVPIVPIAPIASDTRTDSDGQKLTCSDRGSGIEPEKVKIGPPARHMTPWYQRIKAPSAKNHRVGGRWRDTTSRLHAELAHMVLASDGEFHAMTLNLREDIERLALSKGRGAKRFLADRLAYHLRKALGRTVEFWFVLEFGPITRGRLHLHGEIQCSLEEAKKARAALRAAGGKWLAPAVRFQAETTHRPDNGCVSYAFKEPLFGSAGILNLSGSASWKDEPFAITRGLKDRARKLYDVLRKHIALSGRGIRRFRELH